MENLKFSLYLRIRKILAQEVKGYITKKYFLVLHL